MTTSAPILSLAQFLIHHAAAEPKQGKRRSTASYPDRDQAVDQLTRLLTDAHRVYGLPKHTFRARHNEGIITNWPELAIALYGRSILVSVQQPDASRVAERLPGEDVVGLAFLERVARVRMAARDGGLGLASQSLTHQLETELLALERAIIKHTGSKAEPGMMLLTDRSAVGEMFSRHDSEETQALLDKVGAELGIALTERTLCVDAALMIKAANEDLPS